MSRVLELTDELQSCPGFAISRQVRSIALARTMNDQNFQELNGALSNHASSVSEGSSAFLSTSSETDTEIIDVMRRFHNYLASSRTLIEHTRRIVNALCSETSFIDEYQSRVNAEFVACPLSRFIQDLRNFTLHRSIPLRGPSIALGFNGAVTGYYKLDRDELLAWENWHRLSREFMDTVSGHILVDEVSSQYQQRLSAFQDWLDEALQAQFQSELDDEQNLRNEIRQESRRRRGEEV